MTIQEVVWLLYMQGGGGGFECGAVEARIGIYRTQCEAMREERYKKKDEEKESSIIIWVVSTCHAGLSSSSACPQIHPYRISEDTADAHLLYRMKRTGTHIKRGRCDVHMTDESPKRLRVLHTQKSISAPFQPDARHSNK